MQKNQIKKIRLQKGLTQKQLAKLAGTSQQQIQRVESGVQTIRFDLAHALAKALDYPLEELFPTSKTALALLRKRKKRGPAFEDEELSGKFGESGIDIDPRVWTIKYELRNGTKGFHRVSGIEKKRLWRAVQDNDEENPFVIFDSNSHRVALNLNHLVFSHFLFDPPFLKESEKRDDQFLVYISSNLEPIDFDIDPDGVELNVEDTNYEQAQFQNLMMDLEVSGPRDIVHFTDADGETAFFKASEIAMLCAPLWAVEPKLLDEIDFEQDEGEELEG